MRLEEKTLSLENDKVQQRYIMWTNLCYYTFSLLIQKNNFSEQIGVFRQNNLVFDWQQNIFWCYTNCWFSKPFVLLTKLYFYEDKSIIKQLQGKKVFLRFIRFAS